jgi:hypothetical protein
MNILAYSVVKILIIENQIKSTARRNVIFSPSKKLGVSKGHVSSAIAHISLLIKNKNTVAMTVAQKSMAKNKTTLSQFSA